MKAHAAYCYSSGSLTIVFSHDHDQAEIEKDRMKFSDARTVGVTVRRERPRVIAQHLLHKYPGAAYTVRRIAR